jgi:hypothetical protein
MRELRRRVVLRNLIIIYKILSGAHFLSVHIFKVIGSIRVFGVAEYESDVRIAKFKMVDPIWRLY